MELNDSRYALLRTRRRDGTPVDTPIWFHLDGTTMVFRTKIGPKTKRLAGDPHVELWPCDHLGRVPEGAAAVSGFARILDGEEAERGDALLHRRYGWQYKIVPLLKIPGVTNVHAGLPLREKWRRARARGLWPDSAIVRVDLGAARMAGTG